MLRTSAELDGIKDGRRNGTVYRIEFGAVRPDARIALRVDDALTAEDVAAISAKLARLDARSTTGPWAQVTLNVIRDYPEVLAATPRTNAPLPFHEEYSFVVSLHTRGPGKAGSVQPGRHLRVFVSPCESS